MKLLYTFIVEMDIQYELTVFELADFALRIQEAKLLPGYESIKHRVVTAYRTPPDETVK